MSFGKRGREKFVNGQKTQIEKPEDKRGEEEGLESQEELWVNKACCGEEERDS